MTLAPIPYPLVNGVRTDHSSIQVRLNSRYSAIKSINWNESLEPGWVYGNDAVALGWTRGQYKPMLDFELWKPEADVFDDDIWTDPNLCDFGNAAGLYEVFFNVDIFHKQDSDSIEITYVNVQARITKVSTGSTSGSEHHSRKYECVCTPINTDDRFATLVIAGTPAGNF